MSLYRLDTSRAGMMVCLCWLGGCSTYYDGYFYSPRPARIEASHPDGKPTSVVALVSVIGVRRADPSSGDPARVEIRLRLTNHGSGTVTLRPATLLLLSADLQEFPPPRLNVTEAMAVAPGQWADLTGLFEISNRRGASNMDLQSLHLSWQIQIDEQLVPQGVTLTRVYDLDPYELYHYPYGYDRMYFGHRLRCD